MAFTLFNAYAAGQIEDHAELLTQTATDLFAKNLDPGLADYMAANFHHFLEVVPGAGNVSQKYRQESRRRSCKRITDPQIGADDNFTLARISPR